MVMVAPGSDAFMSIVQKAEGKGDFAIAVLPSNKGYALNLIETHGDARYMRTKRSVTAGSVDEVANKVKSLLSVVEDPGPVPIVLVESKKCTLVDEDLKPRTTHEGVIERSFVRV